MAPVVASPAQEAIYRKAQQPTLYISYASSTTEEVKLSPYDEPPVIQVVEPSPTLGCLTTLSEQFINAWQWCKEKEKVFVSDDQSGTVMPLRSESELGSNREHVINSGTISEQLPSQTPTMSRAEIEQLICSYNWPCREALGVVYGNARCPNGESTGRSWVVAEGNFGLFQIHAISHRNKFSGPDSNLLNPTVNVAVAFIIWEDQGWAPWGCRP